jgi:hypothetical protein
MVAQLLPVRKPRQWAFPLASVGDLALTEWPADYSNNIVAEGRPGTDKDGTAVNYLDKLHVIRPNGALACSCQLKPLQVFNYTNAQTPLDFRGLYCEESAEYMRSEITRLKKEGQLHD